MGSYVGSYALYVYTVSGFGEGCAGVRSRNPRFPRGQVLNFDAIFFS